MTDRQAAHLPPRSGWHERRTLITALYAMMAAAALLGLALSWRYASGPRPADNPPSVRVARLLPGAFMWASTPDDVRYLPPGLRPADAARLRMLMLRLENGHMHVFYVPWQNGHATVPVSNALGTPGLPCLDFAPAFATQDIACRQSAPGFDFAQRHRWSLQGKALTAGTPDLTPVQGAEINGNWLPRLWIGR